MTKCEFQFKTKTQQKEFVKIFSNKRIKLKKQFSNLEQKRLRYEKKVKSYERFKKQTSELDVKKLDKQRTNKITKQDTKLKQEIKTTQKDLSVALKRLALVVKAVGVVMSKILAVASLQGLKNELKNIQALEFQIKQVGDKVTRLGGKVLKTSIRIPKTPKITKTPKIINKKPTFIKKGKVIRRKPLRIPIPQLEGLPRTKNKRQGYIIKIKVGDRYKYTPEGLPKNRATNLLRTILDKTPQASGQLIKSKQTNIKDVTSKILDKKFRPKKSKNPKVLIQVEKRKYRLDTKTEKKLVKRKK